MSGKFGEKAPGQEAPRTKWETVDIMEVTNTEFKTFLESQGVINFPWEKVDLSKPEKRKLILELFLDMKL
jgi:hypothetical protein